MATLLNLPQAAAREGFQPVGYLFDREKVLGLQFTKDNPNAGERDKTVPTTIGDLMAETAAWQIRAVETGPDTTTISTATRTMVVRSALFNCELLKTLLDLRSEGADPFRTTWYWYDRGTSLNGARHVHSFFVVQDGRIVRDRVTFVESASNGFDSTVFDEREVRAVWSTDDPTDEAWTRFWYRKFYRETQAGQLMTLRPDAPTLHHYPEGHQIRLAYAAGGLHTDGSAVEADSKLGPAVLRALQEVTQELTSIRNRLISVECAAWLAVGAALIWVLFFRK